MQLFSSLAIYHAQLTNLHMFTVQRDREGENINMASDMKYMCAASNHQPFIIFCCRLAFPPETITHNKLK